MSCRRQSTKRKKICTKTHMHTHTHNTLRVRTKFIVAPFLSSEYFWEIVVTTRWLLYGCWIASLWFIQVCGINQGMCERVCLALYACILCAVAERCACPAPCIRAGEMCLLLAYVQERCACSLHTCRRDVPAPCIRAFMHACIDMCTERHSKLAQYWHVWKVANHVLDAVSLAQHATTFQKQTCTCTCGTEMHTQQHAKATSLTYRWKQILHTFSWAEYFTRRWQFGVFSKGCLGLDWIYGRGCLECVCMYVRMNEWLCECGMFSTSCLWPWLDL